MAVIQQRQWRVIVFQVFRKAKVAKNAFAGFDDVRRTQRMHLNLDPLPGDSQNSIFARSSMTRAPWFGEAEL